MTEKALSLALLLLMLVACGGEETTQPTGPDTGPVDPGTGPIDAALSPEVVTLRDWEWYSASPNRISRICGRAVDETGRPLAGATATLLIPPPAPMSPALEVRSVPADGDGVFGFTDVPRNALIRVSAEGRASWLIDAPTLLRVGGVPFEVPLAPAGEIRGFVTEQDGTPVAGVDVMISHLKPRFAKVVTTGQDGRFHLSAPPTELSAWVISGEFAGRSGDFRVRSGEMTEVRVMAVRPAPLTLEIVDATTGRPLAGVIGSTLFVDEQTTLGDADGRLVIERSCFPRIWLRGAGFEETSADLPENRTAPVTVPVKLGRGVTVRGRVTDPSGKPIEDARIRVLPHLKDARLPVRGPLSGPDGSFELSWALGGEATECTVFAEKPGCYLKSAAVLAIRAGVAEGGEPVVLDRLRRAKIRVLGPDGAPVNGALVTVNGLSAFRAGPFETFNTRSAGLTEADGTVVLAGLAPQNVRMSVQAPNRFEHSENREIGLAEESDLGDVHLTAGLSVAGRIRSTSGTVPPKTRVNVSTGELQLEVDVDPDGSFRCEGLREGPVSLRVRSPDHETLLVSAEAGDSEMDLVITALGSIRITIDRPKEAAVRGWLELRPVGGSVQKRSPVVRPLEERVEAWRFPNLLAGPYRIRIQAGDWYARGEVKLSHGQNLETKLVLVRGATIRGLLLRPDRSPAVGTGLNLTGSMESDRDSRVTDDSGRFEFRGVPEGEVTLSSHPTGFAATRQTVKAVAGETTEVEMVLRVGGRIAITARSASGEAVGGVRVALSRSGVPARFWVEGGGQAQTNEAGSLVLTGLEPGDYDLSLFRSDVRRPSVKVSVAEGGTAPVDVVWE